MQSYWLFIFLKYWVMKNKIQRNILKEQKNQKHNNILKKTEIYDY